MKKNENPYRKLIVTVNDLKHTKMIRTFLDEMKHITTGDKVIQELAKVDNIFIKNIPVMKDDENEK